MSCLIISAMVIIIIIIKASWQFRFLALGCVHVYIQVCHNPPLPLPPSSLRYYSHALAHSLPQTLSRVATTEPDCTNLVLNFFISHITGKPPIKATHKQTLVAKATSYTKEASARSFAQSQVPCLNLLVTAFGYMPLKYSSVRVDPVLFKDSVSMLRKEYRTLDHL